MDKLLTLHVIHQDFQIKTKFLIKWSGAVARGDRIVIPEEKLENLDLRSFL